MSALDFCRQHYSQPVPFDSLVVLQLSHLDRALLSLNIRILDLAVVDDNRIATGAARRVISPADALGKLGFRVRKEKLLKESQRGLEKR